MGLFAGVARRWRAGWCAALALGVVGLAACGGGGTSASPGTEAGVAAVGSTSGSSDNRLSAQASLGELIFKDASLSASGRQSCRSCHDPAFGHAAPNALPAQLGGPLLDQQGSRSAPSIRYLHTNKAFAFAADGTPTGGFFWDGRAASLQAQAGAPFLNAAEMANASAAEVVARLAKASYAAQFQAEFGTDIFNRPDDAFARMTLALQRYQLEDAEFHPYTSKYDAFLRGATTLSAAEMRGLALFNAPDKGNCAACHPSAKGSDGSPPLFTDFTFDTLGVPRNMALARNADPTAFDLGLCARDGGDLLTRTDLCGAFKVPSLRNVALRGALFHNGRFSTLKEALTFYVQRDTNPEKWYPTLVDGTVDVYNDLPPAYRKNVNRTEVPYNRPRGGTPALSDSEIDDVISFLATLTDGWTP